jgi:hypothetical protein
VCVFAVKMLSFSKQNLEIRSTHIEI